MQDIDSMERLTTGWSRLPGFFDSHPTSPQRAAESTNRAENLQWTPRPNIAASQYDFLEKMSGLTLGADPKEGVFEGTRFLHRDMDFSLLFPDGWQLINNHDAVGAMDPAGNAFISLQVAGPGDDPKAMAHIFAQTKLRKENGRVRGEQPLLIGSLSAYRIHVTAGEFKGFMTFIAYNDFIYRLDTLTTGGPIDRYAGRGRAVARSFRPLTEQEKVLFKSTRLSLVTGRAGESLRGLSARTTNELDLATTAVLNDLFIDSRLEEGQWVKIGRAKAYAPKSPEQDSTAAEASSPSL